MKKIAIIVLMLGVTLGAAAQKVTIAAISYDSDIARSPEGNMERVFAYVDKAAAQGCDIIVFPEYCLRGVDPSRKDYMNMFMAMPTGEEVAQLHNNSEAYPEGATLAAFTKKAQEKKIYIIFNVISSAKETPLSIYNSCVLVGPEGFVGAYHKCHLCGGEKNYLTEGHNYPVFDTKFGKIGLLAGYDMMFPEAARALALKGASIIACCSAWPASAQIPAENDRAVEAVRTVTRSAAITNAVYFITANNANPGACSHSEITAPDGAVLDAVQSFGEGMAMTTIKNLKAERNVCRYGISNGLDFLNDRRPDTYNWVRMSKSQVNQIKNNKTNK